MTPQDQRPPDDAAAPFLGLSRRVERRIFMARWLSALRATALPLFGLLGAGLLAAWIGGLETLPLFGTAVLPAALGLVLAWVGGCAVWAHTRMPDHAAALALFDERSERHEMFVSAYSLARDANRGPGGDLHVTRAHAALAHASSDIAQAVPLHTTPASVIAPVAFLVLAAFGLPATAMIHTPGHDATEEAALVGESIDEESKGLEQLTEGLSPEEKKRLEQLKEKLKDSAQKMANVHKDKTARDVLEELERRARDAEKLADMLGAGSEKLGSAMLAELERHADTAELAGALRGSKLEKASTEAGKLARRLRAEDLSLEARKRIENAFEGGLEKASATDLKTLLGTHMTAAQSELDQDKPTRAASEFDRLARSYERMAQRMQSMEALKRLAQNLRSAGQKALGRNSGAMSRLGTVGSKGSKGSQGGLSKVGSQPVRLAMGGNQGSSAGGHQASGSNTPPGRMSQGAPVPGSGSGAQGPQGQPCPGCPNCGRPRPAGPAPLPGTRPGSPGSPPPPGTQPGGT
ncbi:MAG: hypothetical protein P1V36_11170 [Planctomycetota bacterium]|nr:hypothetical protein [Planctomycetota bacterium]